MWTTMDICATTASEAIRFAREQNILNERRRLLDMKNEAYMSLLAATPYGELMKSNNSFDKDSIKDVIYNAPATIVLWKDGSKTVVKYHERDTYNPELGLAMCIIKKSCGNKGNYNDVFNKWLPEELGE